MADPAFALEDAIHQALDTALSIPVYAAGAPAGAAYPYVVLEGSDTASEDSHSQRRERTFPLLSIWSTYRGQKQVKTIIGQIDAALHNQTLALSEGRLVNIQVRRKRVIREPDGVTYQGQVSLEALIEH